MQNTCLYHVSKYTQGSPLCPLSSVVGEINLVFSRNISYKVSPFTKVVNVKYRLAFNSSVLPKFKLLHCMGLHSHSSSINQKSINKTIIDIFRLKNAFILFYFIFFRKKFFKSISCTCIKSNIMHVQV